MRAKPKAGFATAAEYAAGFETLYDRLSEFPEREAPRPALGPNIRIGVARPCIVSYEYLPVEESVVVLRIADGRRKISRKFVEGK